MPRNKATVLPPAQPGGETRAEVYGYLASLGYQNIEIIYPSSDSVLIEADLAGQHYIASVGKTDSLSPAERIMQGYWLALTKDTPFAMPTDGTAQITDGWIKDQAAARDAEDDGYAPTLDE